MNITLAGANGVTTEFQGQQIPMDCICSYTWAPFQPGRIVRNGAMMTCPADHTEVDQG